MEIPTGDIETNTLIFNPDSFVEINNKAVSMLGIVHAQLVKLVPGNFVNLDGLEMGVHCYDNVSHCKPTCCESFITQKIITLKALSAAHEKGTFQGPKRWTFQSHSWGNQSNHRWGHRFA